MKKTVVATALSAVLSTSLLSITLHPSSALATEVITVIGSPITLTEQATIVPTTNTQADFGDQLVRLPGLSISRNGPVTALIQYRGLFGDRVGVSIDGIDINGAGPNAMDSPLSHVLPEPGLTATLYRGIAPVSSGIQTLGGKLNIKSDAAELFSIEKGFQGNVNTSLTTPGSAQQFQGSAFYASDNAFVSGAFMHQQRDKRESGNNAEIPNSNYLRNGAKLRAGYETGKHQFDVSYQTLNTNESGTPALAMDIKFIDAAWYRLGYRYSHTNNRVLSISVFGNDNQHIMDNFTQRMPMTPAMARQNDTDSVAQGINATYVQPFMSGALTLGVDAQHHSNSSVITNPNNAMFFVNNFTNVERDTGSVFAQWDMASSTYESTLGIRATRVETDAGLAGSNMAMMNDAIATLVNEFNNADRSQSDNMIDIAATTVYHFTEHTDIVLGVSQKNRAPTYFERYTWLPLGITGGMADGFNYIGNLNLTHETARQLEFGLDISFSNWTVSPRLFYQDIEDYITGSPSMSMAANMVSTMMSGRTPFQWTNTDAVIKGGDITVTGDISGSLSLNMVASFQHGNRDDIDDALFRIAPEQLITRLQWSSTLFDSPAFFNVTSELAGRQSHVSMLQNEQGTAGYGLVHLSALWQLTPAMHITVSANNVFDKHYTPHTGGVNRVMNTSVAVGERLPGAGQEWQMSFSYQF
jgi:iron complex outermembrane receptor protein